MEFKAVTREDLEKKVSSPAAGQIDPEKTAPNLKVGTFPKASGRPLEQPPTIMNEGRLREANRIIRAIGKPYEYGGIKLHDIEFQPNGDLAGTDENGVRFIVPRDEVHVFLEDEGEPAEE
jgi:hypothetical protein